MENPRQDMDRLDALTKKAEDHAKRFEQMMKRINEIEKDLVSDTGFETVTRTFSITELPETDGKYIVVKKKGKWDRVEYYRYKSDCIVIFSNKESENYYRALYNPTHMINRCTLQRKKKSDYHFEDIETRDGYDVPTISEYLYALDTEKEV